MFLELLIVDACGIAYWKCWKTKLLASKFVYFYMKTVNVFTEIVLFAHELEAAWEVLPFTS
jgi:hypothetical protein